MPVAAMYELATGRLTVEFNRELKDQPLTDSNWLLLIEAGPENPLSSPSIELPDAIALEFVNGLADVLSIEYLASPPDVGGTGPSGLQTPAFVFPVTVV